MSKPPFTEAEKQYLHSEFERFKRTGYGIDPRQQALRHHDDVERCGCHWCSGAEILYTREMIPVQNFRRIERNPLPPVAQVRMSW